jgi:hypothetical protein
VLDVGALSGDASPSQYVFHKQDREPRLDVFGFKPSYEFSPLSSLSVIFRLARYRPATAQGVRVQVIDSWHTERPSRFLTDNFGTYLWSHGGNIYPPDAAAAASLLTIVSPEKQADPRYGVPRDLNAIPSEMAAFKEFAECRAANLSLASMLFAPKLDIRAGRWSGSFNLVVGDSLADRILFWNARLLIPSWLDTDLCYLRVGLDRLREAEFLVVLSKLLKRRNYVTDGGGGQPQLTVRSASLSTNQLEEVLKLVLSPEPWSEVTTEAVSGLERIAPSADALQAARESNRFGGELFPRPEWTPFMWSPPMADPRRVYRIIFQMLRCDKSSPKATGARILSLSMTVPVQRFAHENGCCRADGEWPVLSRHHWLVSRYRPRRLRQGEAAMETWQFL